MSWFADMESSSNKIVLVIGVNKGIRFEVARQIGRNGARAILGALTICSGGRPSFQTLSANGNTSQHFSRFWLRFAKDRWSACPSGQGRWRQRLLTVQSSAS